MFKIINWKREELVLSVDLPKDFQENKSYKAIVICHGLIGSRVGVDRLFVKAAQRLTKENYVVFRFDYSGCGESSGTYGNYSMPELIEQTKAIINYASELPYVEELILLGHSLGGATALLTANTDKRIRKLIQWAAVSDPYKELVQIFGEDYVQTLDHVPAIDFNGYYFSSYYFDQMKNFHPLEEAAAFMGNVLLIHGTEDEDIAYEGLKNYKKSYLKRSYGNVETDTIYNANHTFSNGKHYQQLIDKTCEWLQKVNTDYY
ncbi:alpha/beta hydrolase [Niallia sp. NCCP-28]|uniref:alpha/beta hydrolase n=1 Tax=Niallia sp. NCCP-28 TaxID=2934712 RepID=UPI00208A3210|nr:alpha/beta fold hydrolase [Niallia sp. NCCP-28]GKU83160.1 2-hydroxy-6-oxohepta-2,4-dienoate hydrolase [Niallia sp. NCCP-28]